MSSRASIEFDFKKACQQAGRLEELAGELQNLSNNRFGGTMQNLAASWKGENATAYLRKGTQLQSEIISTSRDLQNAASGIRAIARRIYDAEMEALRIAEMRSY